MREVPLTRGMVALVDDEDFELVSGFHWHSTRGNGLSRNVWYAGACVSKARARQIGRRHVSMHRLIMGFPKHQVDHIDGDGLNNQRSNLRPANNSTNQMNKGKSRRNSSCFKGVSWRSSSRKWQASICKNKKQKYLGEFRTALSAALSYDDAATRLFGEFARINFPERRSDPGGTRTHKPFRALVPQTSLVANFSTGPH